MKIVICGTNNETSKLVNLIKQKGDHDVCLFDQINNLLKSNIFNQTDALFLKLDIDYWDKINFSTLIKYINPNIFIVYIYNRNSFEMESSSLFSCIHSPINADQFNTLFSKILAEYKYSNTIIPIKNTGSLTFINIKDILYIESYYRKTTIHTLERAYITTEKFNTIYDKVKIFEFVQPHQSFIVNLKYITSINNDYLILNNNEKIKISARRRKIIKDKFTKYKISSLIK